MDECEHGDYPDTCPPCRRAAGKYNEVKREKLSPHSFEAKFGGTCTECEGSIEPGDFIVTDAKGYTHEECWL